MISIIQAVTLLRQGGLVAFPTETVYGLGADALNPLALKKIFAAKERPADHPLIVHVANVSQLTDFAREIPDMAYTLADAFWPGPLTLVLKKAEGVSDWVTGGQDTVGIRIPRHPVAAALLRAFGGGLAAPSANRFGRISPTSAAAVREELGSAVDAVLEGGDCEVGLESTILDLSTPVPRILRPGMITAEQITTVLQTALASTTQDAPRVSGSLESHYAPQTEMIQLSTAELLAAMPTLPRPAAILTREVWPTADGLEMVLMPSEAVDYAHLLYSTLRRLDKKNLCQIIVEMPPATNEWDAIRDRLKRATARC